MALFSGLLFGSTAAAGKGATAGLLGAGGKFGLAQAIPTAKGKKNNQG